MKKTLLFSFILVCLSTLSFAQPTNWLYEKPFSVTNSSPQLITNYTMAIVVDTKTLIAAGKMQDSCQDIRFGVQCNGNKLFTYFIDSGINTTQTLIYVQIDSLKANSTRSIYMFYGNPAAAPATSLGALNGPYTMFNGVGPVSSSDSLPPSSANIADTIQTGVYFQPNQQLIVTALGGYIYESGNVTLQLSSYNASLAGTLLANAYVSNIGYSIWKFVSLPSPIVINPANTTTFSVSAAFSYTFGAYYYDQITPPAVSPQVSILGGAHNQTFTLPILTTAPPVYTSSTTEGFTDIRYYLPPVQNSYVSYVADTAINASAFIDPVNRLVCPSTPITFTAVASGLAPTYQWQVNDGHSWVNATNGAVYTGVNLNTLTIPNVTAAMSGYQYRAYMTSTCGVGYSNPATLTVNTTTPILPIVNITGPNPACAYANATYTATTNVPSATYAWYVNSQQQFATGSQFGFVPTATDTVYVVVTNPTNAALGCFYTGITNETSNRIILTVGSSFTPHDSIAASSNNSCQGTLVDYNGFTNVYGGSYQWLVNGVPAPNGTASTFSYAPNSGDQITEVIYTPNNGCYNTTNTTSQPVVATTMATITPTIVVTGPKTAKVGESVTVVANISNYGTGYTLMWANQANQVGTFTNTNTFTFAKSAGMPDYISARIIPVSPWNGSCYEAVSTTTPLEVDITPYNTGVNNVANSNGISVYPNPFGSKINVTGLTAGDHIMVYDMTGRSVTTVYQAANATEEYSLDQLAAGHYILHVTSADGTVKANLPVSKL